MPSNFLSVSSPSDLPVRRLPIASLLLCLLGVLLAAVGPAAAAASYVPRMERVAACSWDRPGHNPFMGDVVAAVDRYSDIPTAVRARLKQRMQARQYDDFVDIRRDSISGRAAYEPTIRDMHFGLDQVCRQVTRARWSAQMHERGVVYCEQEHCILVPTVCRNVSRIQRRPALVAGESSRDTPGPEVAAEAKGASAASGGSGPRDDASERAAARGPGITSSFAEAVAGATLPLWPAGGDDGGDSGGGGSGGPTTWLSTPVGGGSAFSSGSPGAPGGSSGAADGNDAGGNPGGGTGTDGGGSGGAGGSGSGSGGVPGFPSIDAAPPVSAIPEPATWASLLAGLAVLALVSARRRRRG